MQFHSMDYPSPYVPRDDLTESDDLLDWFAATSAHKYVVYGVLDVLVIILHACARSSYGVRMHDCVHG